MSGELRAVCVGDTGMWGAILMRREPGAPAFTTRDVDLLASLSGGHPDVQRAKLERPLAADADDRDPGLLLLDDDDGVDMANACAAAWLDDLPDHGRQLPFVVTAVAERARAIASGHDDSPASARGGQPPAAGFWCPDQWSATGPGRAPRSRWSRRELPSSPRSSRTPTASLRASGP